MSDMSDRTTVVVGASRGLGRGVAEAFAEAGAPVIAVARTATEFTQPANGAGSIVQEIADAGEAPVAAAVIDRHRPSTVVLAAGAVPHMRPLRHQTWETFSLAWDVDVRISFHWVREILLTPLPPGSRVVVISSGAAVGGSPLSGGYAGAKQMQRFLASYAQGEAERAGLDITFTAVLPRFAPETGVGWPAVRAYADHAGMSLDDFLSRQGPLLTPEIAGRAVLDLARTDRADLVPAYTLSGAGLNPLG